MSPRLASPDRPEVRHGYPVLGGEPLGVAVSQHRSPDRADVIGTDLGGVDLLAPARVRRPGVALAPLRPHVRHVVGVRAGEQVVRADTCANVAPVEDVKAVWHLAVGARVGVSVRAHRTTHHPEHSVPGRRTDPPQPQPATVGRSQMEGVEPLVVREEPSLVYGHERESIK